jgi:hypothetical protein
MRKLILVLLLLLVPSLVIGGSLDSTRNVRVAARRALGVDTTGGGLTDANANYFIQEALVMHDPVLRGNVVEWVFTTTYNEYQYSIDSNIIGIISAQIEKGDVVKPLLPIPIAGWDQMKHKSTKSKKDLERYPSYYDWTDDYLFLFPVPTRENSDYDTVRVIGYRNVAEVDTIVDLSHLPERYKLAIRKYVTWQAALANSDPRTAGFEKVYDQQVAILRGEKIRGPVTK